MTVVDKYQANFYNVSYSQKNLSFIFLFTFQRDLLLSKHPLLIAMDAANRACTILKCSVKVSTRSAEVKNCYKLYEINSSKEEFSFWLPLVHK